MKNFMKWFKWIVLLVAVGLLAWYLFLPKSEPQALSICNGDCHPVCSYGDSEGANLYTKDSSTWERVDGAYGFINLEENNFWANKLQPQTEYSLIIYDMIVGDDDDTEWAGEGYEPLATGESDECGNLNLEFKLPFCLDEAKVWLVPADHYNDGYMVRWSPREYLFEAYRFDTCEELLPSPTPTPEPQRVTTEAGTPQCNDSTPLVLPSNVHVIRNGSDATVNFFTQSSNANIYYRTSGQPVWQHALRDISVTNGYVSVTIHDLVPTGDYDFGIQAANSCNGGETVLAVVVDDYQPKTFMFSYWSWL